MPIFFAITQPFSDLEKFFTSQPPKIDKNKRGLLSGIFSKIDIWPYSDIVKFA